jgi:hypothetical protein
VRTDHAISAAAAETHGIFNAALLDGLGVSHHDRTYRVRTGRWIRVHEGVFRIAGAPETWHGNLLAACWAGGAQAVASFRAAAALWELPGGLEKLEITCPRWRRTRSEGLIVHESTRLDRPDRTLVGHIPCTSIERTVFDMCGLGGPAFTDLLFDSALRRGLTTIEHLVATRDRLAKRGRRGGAQFRQAVDERDPTSALPESEPERMLARYLVENGLPKPVHQHVVRDGANRFVARVDLAYPAFGVIIEYESAVYHTGKVALERDSDRRNALTSLGLSVVTATGADLRDRARTLSAQLRPLLRTLPSRELAPPTWNCSK